VTDKHGLAKQVSTTYGSLWGSSSLILGGEEHQQRWQSRLLFPNFWPP